MKGFLLGFKSPFVGLRLVWRGAGLRKYAIIPVLIDFVLLVLGLYYGWIYWPDIIGMLISKESGFWSAVIYYLAFTLGFLVFVVMLSFFVFLLSEINGILQLFALIIYCQYSNFIT